MRSFKSDRVAKPEKPPRFACSHSVLPLLDETQPGSAKKTEAKVTGGMLHLSGLGLYRIEPDCLPLPDEPFLERNGLMK